MPIDISGQPVHPAILWMDERAAGLLPFIAGKLGTEEFHRITGKPLSGNLTIAKIFWLREHEPEIFARTWKFLDTAAFLNHKLTGAYATGWGSADPTGLFDICQNRWSAPILEFLQLREDQLPAAYPAGAVIGQVTPAAAQICHLPVGLPVIAGLGDGQAAGVGANITQSGQAYLSLGTSVVSGTYSQGYHTDRAFRTMYGLPGAYSLETVLLGGTYTLDWFIENFAGERQIEQFETEIAAIPPGSEGLLLVPYWNSVMNPYWDTAASGITLGWRGHHRATHLYRAILEGIAFEMNLHLEGVESALNTHIEHLVTVGGGSRSDLWCQIIADVTGKSILRTPISEATALGAGILAAVGTGLFSNARLAAEAMSPPVERTFTPDGADHAVYITIYRDVFKRIYPALQPLATQLSQIISP